MDKKSREIFLSNFRFFVRWTAVSVFIGFSVGFIGAIFRKGVDLMTRNWNAHPEVMFLAPFAGLLKCYRRVAPGTPGGVPVEFPTPVRASA